MTNHSAKLVEVVSGDCCIFHTETTVYAEVCRDAIMNFNDQSRCCHAERSEASLGLSNETLRCAQGDNTFPIWFVKLHDRVRVCA